MICEKCRGQLKIECVLFEGGFEVEISYCPKCETYVELNVTGLEEA